MNKIKVMDSNLSNKIAAGEVVETLMNVVKELVENSIDANSSYICVELLECGIKEISVLDDGDGMSREDALNCLKRHATSKIYEDDDLFHINTLGFRGEALPSISSVSKMTLETSDGEDGTIIDIVGGDIINISSNVLRKGTKISVRDLFFNTPARLKYLKNLHTELANITSYLNKMCLCYPGVKFKLINDGKILINTDGSSNLLKVINSIYGLDVTKKMIKISNSNSDYDISGYISYPEINRSSKNFITLLVNGRYVKNSEIIRSILDGYHTYLPIGRSPIVVLNIEADSSIVDVNVHPTKMEVKFSKSNELNELVYSTINEAIHKLMLVPEIKESDKVVSNIDKVTTINDKVDFKDKEVVLPVFEEVSFDFNTFEEEISYESSDDKKIKPITPIGIVHSTYIIGENEDGMYIIDQHAAQERINYEKYLKALGEDSDEVTDLLVPFRIELSNDEYISLKDKFDILRSINISFEEFGFNTLIIRSHPVWIGDRYALEKIRKIIEVIISSKDFSKEKFNEKIAINLACKMSIKANDYISLDEASVLIDTLFKCNNPYTCPHGRPTIINYSFYELEKLFKRVM